MIRLQKFGAALPKLRYCGNLLQPKCISKLPSAARTYMKKTSEIMQSHLKKRDFIPEGFHIVYRGDMDNYVHLAHNSSAIMFFLGIGIAYRSFYIEDETVIPMKILYIPVEFKYTEVLFMYVVYIFSIVSMRSLSSKYVLRMYYNPTTNTYRAMKCGYLPTITRSVDFQAGTLEKSTKRYFIPWRSCIYKINHNKIMFFEQNFKTSADYDRLFKV